MNAQQWLGDDRAKIKTRGVVGGAALGAAAGAGIAAVAGATVAGAALGAGIMSIPGAALGFLVGSVIAVIAAAKKPTNPIKENLTYIITITTTIIEDENVLADNLHYGGGCHHYGESKQSPSIENMDKEISKTEDASEEISKAAKNEEAEKFNMLISHH